MPIRAIIFFVWHFLRPTARAKARSAITILASIVIALVVALTLAYTSITKSIELKWEKQIAAFWAPIRLSPTFKYQHSYFTQVPLFSSSRDFTEQTLGQELQFQGHPPLQRAHSDALLEELTQQTKIKDPLDWKDSYQPDQDPPLPPFLAKQRKTLKSHPLLELNSRIDRYRKNGHHEKKSFSSRFLTSDSSIEWIEVFQSMGRWRQSAAPSTQQDAMAQETHHHGFILSYDHLPGALIKQIDPLSEYECKRLHRILSLQEHAETHLPYHPPHLSLRLLETLDKLPTSSPKEFRHKSTSILQALNLQSGCVILPCFARKEGIEVGDIIDISAISQQGHITSYSANAALVIGFFSTEMQGWSNRSIITSAPLGKKIYLGHPKNDPMVTNHIGIWIQENSRQSFKKELSAHFSLPGASGTPLTDWFAVESLEDYPFCKDFILQLASDRIVLMGISFLILIVASSSIVSMLIILVHERRDSIAIFRVLGVPKRGITKLFAFLGLFIGAISSAIGLLLGISFLKLLPWIASFISHSIGHELFNPIYFGKTLPTGVDPSTALWICSATTMLSLIAGSLAARYATSYQPQKLLQNQ